MRRVGVTNLFSPRDEPTVSKAAIKRHKNLVGKLRDLGLWGGDDPTAPGFEATRLILAADKDRKAKP